jgi:hypothetical protein
LTEQPKRIDWWALTIARTRTAGGTGNIRREAVDASLARITTDRAGEAEPEPVVKPARRERIQRLDAALAAAGFLSA